jgi:hypothetical protein
MNDNDEYTRLWQMYRQLKETYCNLQVEYWSLLNELNNVLSTVEHDPQEVGE